jgi:hypothetical protein
MSSRTIAHQIYTKGKELKFNHNSKKLHKFINEYGYKITAIDYAINFGHNYADKYMIEHKTLIIRFSDYQTRKTFTNEYVKQCKILICDPI